MSVKVFEAREHCKAAEKFLKTSLLRWKPDYDSAADEYSQAAQCYRIARDAANSKDCHLKASECYKKNNAFFHAAKALENAVLVCKDTATPQELHKLALESGELYQQHGSGDSAASVLGKTAKIIEEASPELAVELFQMAADASAVESLYRDNIRSRSEHVWDSATASTSRPRIPPTATATTSQQADEMMHQALRGRVQAVQNEHDRETAAIDRELKRLDEDLDRRLKALHDQFTQVSETERPEEATEPDAPPEIPELLPNETSVVALDPQPGPSTSQAGFSLTQPDEVLANLQVILHDENAMDSGVSDNPGPSFANHPRQNFFEEFQRRLSQDLNIQLTVPEILLNFGNPPDQRVLDDFIRRVEEGASSGLTQADQTGSDHRPRRTFIDEFQR